MVFALLKSFSRFVISLLKEVWYGSSQAPLVISEPVSPQRENLLSPENKELFNRIKAQDPQFGTIIANRLFGPFRTPRLPAEECWLDDTAICNFIGSLEKKYSDKNVTYIAPQFYQTKDFVPRLKGEGQSLRRYAEKLKLADLLFWPIREGMHWYLLVIHKKPNHTFHLGCLDGFNNDEFHKHIFARARLVLHAIYHGEPIHITRTQNYKIPIQDNIISCGDVVCLFAKEISKGRSPSTFSTQQATTTRNYLPYRMRIAKALAEMTPDEFKLGHTVNWRDRLPPEQHVLKDNAHLEDILTLKPHAIDLT